MLNIELSQDNQIKLTKNNFFLKFIRNHKCFLTVIQYLREVLKF